jgi:hypothetical protein
MKNGGHNFHPANVPGRTKFLLNLELEREQEKLRKAREKKNSGLTPNVRDLFKN